MSSAIRRRWALGGVLLAACTVAPLELAGRPCPCPAGLVCLEASRTCAAELPALPFSVDVDATIDVPRKRTRMLSVRLTGELARAVSLRIVLAGPYAPIEGRLASDAAATELPIAAPDLPPGTMVSATLEATAEGVPRPWSKEIAIRVTPAPGDPDLAFGTNGVLSVDLSAHSEALPTFVGAPILVIDALGGALVAMGIYLICAGPDGAIDMSFGVAGRAELPFSIGTVVPLADGVLVLAVNRATATLLDRFGRPRESFGTAGTVTLEPPSGFSMSAWTVAAPLADGGFLLGGWARADAGMAPFLARLRADGAFDPSFGAAGIRMGKPSSYDKIESVGAYLDTKFIVRAREGGEDWVEQLRSDAEPDPMFARLSLPRSMYGSRWDYTAKGVPFGSARSGLLRLLPDGRPDPSFGDGGYVRFAFSASRTVAVDDRGFLSGGYAGTECIVARVSEKGHDDTEFGVAGRVTFPCEGFRAFDVARRGERALAATLMLGPPRLSLRRYHL